MKAAAVTIRPMTAADWPRVSQIYRRGTDTGNAMFETAAGTPHRLNLG